MFEAGAAVRAAFFGNVSEARQNAKAALELSKSRDVEYGAAFALAVSGDNVGSENLVKDLQKRFPEDTCVRFTYLPIQRAILVLNQGDFSSAIEQLQLAAPYDLAVPCSWFGYFGYFYAPYMRGEAYRAARRYAEAAAEFKKILDHPGIIFVDPVRVVARLQFGRALAATGDGINAKRVYQEFLNHWKDADTDVPILKQAQAEYAKL